MKVWLDPLPWNFVAFLVKWFYNWGFWGDLQCRLSRWPVSWPARWLAPFSWSFWPFFCGVWSSACAAISRRFNTRVELSIFHRPCWTSTTATGVTVKSRRTTPRSTTWTAASPSLGSLASPVVNCRAAASAASLPRGLARYVTLFYRKFYRKKTDRLFDCLIDWWILRSIDWLIDRLKLIWFFSSYFPVLPDIGLWERRRRVPHQKLRRHRFRPGRHTTDDDHHHRPRRRLSQPRHYWPRQTPPLRLRPGSHGPQPPQVPFDPRLTRHRLPWQQRQLARHHRHRHRAQGQAPPPDPRPLQRCPHHRRAVITQDLPGDAQSVGRWFRPERQPGQFRLRGRVGGDDSGPDERVVPGDHSDRGSRVCLAAVPLGARFRHLRLLGPGFPAGGGGPGGEMRFTRRHSCGKFTAA